jgi:hypothetical protein
VDPQFDICNVSRLDFLFFLNVMKNFETQIPLITLLSLGMATSDDGIKAELLKMEEAARVMMSQNVDAIQRREAESYFIRLKESNIAPQVCQAVLETTSEPFVIFQISQCFALSLVRNYDAYAEEDIQGACKYLLEMPVDKEK